MLFWIAISNSVERFPGAENAHADSGDRDSAQRLPPCIWVSALLPENYSAFLPPLLHHSLLSGITTGITTGEARASTISHSTPQSSRGSLPHSVVDPSPRCIHSRRTALLFHLIRPPLLTSSHSTTRLPLVFNSNCIRGHYAISGHASLSTLYRRREPRPRPRPRQQ